ncbi:MAG TPA: MopE-related protein, partial [Polyangiales bacterium]
MRKLATVLCLLGLSVGCGGEEEDAAEQRGDAATEDASAEPEDASAEPDTSVEADGGAPTPEIDANLDGSTQDDAASADDATLGTDGDVHDDAPSLPDSAPSCVPDGKPELCDGVDNDCDPTTPDGNAEPTRGQTCDGADTDTCSEGTVQCSGGALACNDDSGDASEVCDGLDNDCDGSVDETCQKADFHVLDFAVDGAGASVAAGTVANQVRMMCFGPDGAIVRSAFDVAGPEQNDHSILFVAVARARDAGNIAVAFTYRKSTNWFNYIAFFDRECQLVAGRQVLDSDLPNGGGLNRRATLTMTDDGRTYVLYEHEAQLKFRALAFNTAGARTLAVTLTRPTECAGDGRPAVLALNAHSGDFAVVCEASSERRFRRFSASGAPLDEAMRPVPGSQPDGFSFHYWTA